MSTPHVVHAAVIELHASERGLAERAQGRVAARWDAALAPVLAEVMDRHAPGDEPWVLDRLELDLGEIGIGELDEVLPERVAKRLGQALEAERQRTAGFTPAPPGVGAAHATRAGPGARVLHLLETGTLPWWSEDVESSVLDGELGALLREEPQRVRQWLRDLPASTAWRAVVRVRWQLGPGLASRLLGVVSPRARDALGAARERLAADVAGCFEELAWHVVIGVAQGDEAGDAHSRAHAVAGAAGTPAPVLLADLLEALGVVGGTGVAAVPAPRAAGGAGERDPARRARETVDDCLAARGTAPRGSPAAQGPARPEHRSTKARDATGQRRPPRSEPAPPHVDDVRAALRSEVHEVARDEDARPCGPGAAIAHAPMHGSRPADGARARSPNGWPAPVHGAVAHPPRSPAAGTREVDATAGTRADAAGSLAARRHGDAPAVALPVSNAGLVLLWPFLPPFLETLGLRDAGGWSAPAAAAQAVHLLQWLVRPHGDAPEHRLVLNKVLCGLPLDEPVPLRAELTAREREEALALAAALIGHWRIVGKLSVDGLRNSFLARAGLLDRRGDHWRLRVEPAAWDLVLAYLPFPIEIVQLSWMPHRLEVLWTTP